VGTLAGDRPVVFDPAVYYGHAEVDLAMLSLFGRVPETFYRAYGQNPRAAIFSIASGFTTCIICSTTSICSAVAMPAP
jgi:fructosamine-3-kinase